MCVSKSTLRSWRNDIKVGPTLIFIYLLCLRFFNLHRVFKNVTNVFLLISHRKINEFENNSAGIQEKDELFSYCSQMLFLWNCLVCNWIMHLIWAWYTTLFHPFTLFLFSLSIIKISYFSLFYHYSWIKINEENVDASKNNLFISWIIFIHHSW